jgi:hypothetical protein
VRRLSQNLYLDPTEDMLEPRGVMETCAVMIIVQHC